MNAQLNINQIANVIAKLGHQKSYMVQGDIGSGKSSLLKMVGGKHPGMKLCYVDCTQIDVGDVQIPAVDHTTKTVSFYPNSIFGAHLDVPVAVMLDEFGKAPEPVKNALLPMILEHRIGAARLPSGSIVFMTTNKGSEGIGDSMKAHVRNRYSKLTMRKSTSEEWISWGMDNNINEAVLMFAKEMPQIFQSFEDIKSPADNPYIFHPKEQREAFVTPRSLESASNTLHYREAVNDPESTFADMVGTIGPRAASDLNAFVVLGDKLPRYSDIVTNPTTARIPADNGAAMCMTTFSCVSRVQKGELNEVLTYIERMPSEMKALFIVSLLRTQSKSSWAAMNRKFSEEVTKNSWALA